MEVINRLLSAGADVNSPGGNNGGRTALQVAAIFGRLDVVELLLSRGANVNQPAARYHGRSTPPSPFPHPIPNTLRNLTNYSPLAAFQASCEDGHVAVIQRLISAGATINDAAGWSSGRTALQAACEGGHISTVKLLLDLGADINAPGSRYKGRTALQAASANGSLELVDLLLEAGADVNAPACRFHGLTALQCAAVRGPVAIVERLVKAGADMEVCYFFLVLKIRIPVPYSALNTLLTHSTISFKGN